MRPEDFPAEDASLALWPDNVVPVSVFLTLGTQWRVGLSGPTGLDYNVLPTVLRLNAVPRKDWPDIFADLRVLEAAALETMRKKD